MVDVLDKCLQVDEVRRLDVVLSALGRGQAGLRLRVGELGEELGRKGGFAELGFSRVADYARERCGKKSGWFREVRSVARSLEKLPEMRGAVCNGELSWSMAVLCASKTTPEREAEVLAKAKTSTVRQMRNYFGQAAAASTMPDMQTEPSRWNSWEELEQLEMCDEEGSYARKRGEQGTGAENLCLDASHTCSAPMDGGTGGTGSGGMSGDADGEPTELDEEAAATYDQITRRTLQRTVPEDVVDKFEATRILLQHLEGEMASSDTTADAIMEAMLAEAQTKLAVGIDLGEMQDELESADELRRNWLRAKRAWTEAAHAACEPRLPSPESADVLLAARPIPDTPEEIDAEIVGLCETLAIRDLQMGILAEAIVKADGWRRMGFADLGQYARERVGVSRRTLEQKMRLARDVRRFPAVGDALQRKEINVEAALRISKIASEKTVGAWIERAARRTVKHLDEEIEAVRRFERLGAPKDMGPPSEATLEAAFEIERMVVSGRLLDDKREAATGGSQGEEQEHEHELELELEHGGSVEDVLDAGSEAQMSDAGCDGDEAQELGPGRAQMSDARCDGDEAPQLGSDLTQMSDADLRAASASGVLRLQLSQANYIQFIALEKAYERHAKVPGKDFVEFMLEAVWETWGPQFRRKPAYHEIYERDRYRCTNPVCYGRVLNPHHLRFRSQGGTDHPENLGTACWDCHVPGIHEGKIKVSPPASNMRWVIGREGTLVVQGRDKVSSRLGAAIKLLYRHSRARDAGSRYTPGSVSWTGCTSNWVWPSRTNAPYSTTSPVRTRT